MIDIHNALDLQVHELVMGQQERREKGFDEAGTHVGSIIYNPRKPYSQVIADAWLVVERLREMGYNFELYDSVPEQFHFRCWKSDDTTDCGGYCIANTAAEAICKGAISAMQSE